MNKNIFKAAALFTALISVTTTQAAIVDKIQPEGSKIFTEGTVGSGGELYPVTVIKKGTNLNKLTETKPDVYYQGEIKADNDGSTKLTFKMPSRSETGEYVLRVNNGTKIEEYEFYYLSSFERQQLIDKINTGVKSEITDVLANNSENLGLTLGKEAKIDISGVVNRIHNLIIANPDYENIPVFMEETFIKAYQEAVVAEAFAQKKSDFLIENGAVKYNEYTNIDKSVLYGEYQVNISYDGKTFVNNSVVTSGCTTWTEVADSFDKNAAYALICRYKDDGYGHVNEKLTTYKSVFQNDLMIDFTYYDYLTPDEKITFARELNVKSIAGPSQLKSKIEETAKSVYNRRLFTNVTVGGGGSGGAGGSGGSGGGSAKLDVNVSGRITETAGVFSDIYTVEWARKPIEYLAGKNIVCGKATGRFYPNDNITREEFMKIICLAFNISTDGAISSFADVKPGEWYYPYVSALYNLGVVSGIDETSFGTGLNITREQMAVIMARILNVSSQGSEKFSDDYNISDYAKNAVYAMREKGIISGVGNNIFNPQGAATRAEAAKIVYSAIINQ